MENDSGWDESDFFPNAESQEELDEELGDLLDRFSKFDED